MIPTSEAPLHDGAPCYNTHTQFHSYFVHIFLNYVLINQPINLKSYFLSHFVYVFNSNRLKNTSNKLLTKKNPG